MKEFCDSKPFIRKSACLGVLMLCSAMLVSCGGKKNVTGPDTNISLKSIRAARLTAAVGATNIAPEITWDPPNASNKNYTLSTDASSVVAIVGETMNAISVGVAAVRVVPEDGGTAKQTTFRIDVTGEIPVQAIRVSDTTVVIGQAFEPKITWIPEDASVKTFTLESLDTSAVTIDGNVALAIPVEGMVVEDATIEEGQVSSFVPTVRWVPENASIRTFTLESSNTIIAQASLDNRELVVLKSGFTRVTVIPDDGGSNKAETFLLDVIPARGGAGDYRVPSSDINLMATVSLPSGSGPHPAIVLVHGSGSTPTRTTFIPFSNFLTARGFATIGYDKRGTGESEGIFIEAQISIRADDVNAAVQFLKQRPDIDPEKIGLLGWSQAGWVIPLAASQSQDVKFIVPIVGPTVTIGQENFYSQLTGEQQFNRNGTVNGFTVAQLTEMVRNYSGFQGFDPVPAIQSLNIPGLWLYGEYDESIPTALSLEILEKIIADHNKDFEIKVYEHANHGLVDIVTGQQIRFMTETVGPWLIERIQE
jgi:dienelactone hydrolase